MAFLLIFLCSLSIISELYPLFKAMCFILNRRGRGQRGRGRPQRFEAPAIPQTEPLERKEEPKDTKKDVTQVTRNLLGVVLVSCQLQLSMCTRQIGFLIQLLFQLLQQNNVDAQCTCFQLYRIMLYSVSVKLSKQRKRAVPWYNIQENRPQILERIQSALQTDLRLPIPFVEYLDSIGDFEQNSVYYNAFIPTFQGPHPLYTTIENLWGTVAALSNPQTPLIARMLFFINNPLPGAVWNNPDDPVLLNPHDYIGAHYDINAFEADLDAVNSLNTALRKRRWPALQAEKVDLDKSGDAALLISSTFQESVIRCVNLANQGQTVEGNRTDFNLTSPGASTAQAHRGAVNLYSEVVRLPDGTVPPWDTSRTAGYFSLRLDWRAENRKSFTTA